MTLSGHAKLCSDACFSDCSFAYIVKVSEVCNSKDRPKSFPLLILVCIFI